MRTVVFAYQSIGHACLEEVLRQGHDVAAVVTVEDDPNENIWFQSVADLARSAGLPVLLPGDPNGPETIWNIRSLAPDIIFSFYYRYMMKPELLEIAPRGALNMHGSYLPKYRGRCPVNWVLVHGETETGVTLHYMVERPDAGDIVAQRKFPIEFTDTAQDIYEKMIPAARDIMVEVLPLLDAGTAPRIPQDPSQASYFGGRKPADGRFEWSWPALRIYNLVRAVTHPYPGAFVETPQGKLLVWSCWPEAAAVRADPGTLLETSADGVRVATGEGSLLLRTVQPEGGPEVGGADIPPLVAGTL